MDIGKAFSFVFEDEKWVSKVLHRRAADLDSRSSISQ